MVLMGTNQDHLRYAEACLAEACAANDDTDKALWLMLGQSWVRLAEQVAGSAAAEGDADEADEGVRALHAPEFGVAESL
jgi:hypothetical protein